MTVMNNRIRLYNLFKFWVFVIFIVSMCPWFTLNISKMFFSFPFFILSLLILQDHRLVRYNPKYNWFFIPVFLLCLYTGRNNTIPGLVDVMIHAFGFYVFWMLKDDYKVDIIKFITKSFAIILIPSIIAHILFLIGIKLPNYTIYSDSEAYPILLNYYFFVQVPYSIRFFGYFIEPGHMTMGLAPLLFVNKYDFKNKYVLILLFAQLLSFSLAGYIVAALGYMIVRSKDIYSVKALFSILSLGILVYVFILAIEHLMNENVFLNLIWERMQWVDGRLVGDDRTTSDFDIVYQRFIKTSDILWGSSDWGEHNFMRGLAGYKKFLISNGILGLVLWFLSFSFLIRDKEYRNVGLFVVLTLLLYQNAYPLWWCIIIPCCMGSRFYKIST